MLDVEKLVVLRAVAAHGSIAAAGREIGYTRSAVSQQLSALERAVGVALLIRGGNSVTVTPAGRRLLAAARTRKDAFLSQRLDALAPEDRATLERAAALLEGMLE